LITFTAYLPVAGGSNGTLVVAYSLAHSASSISAFDARFSFSNGSSAPQKYAWRTASACPLSHPNGLSAPAGNTRGTHS
jgi:hypothetical protein